VTSTSITNDYVSFLITFFSLFLLIYPNQLSIVIIGNFEFEQFII